MKSGLSVFAAGLVIAGVCLFILGCEDSRTSETEQTKRLETLMSGYERLADKMALMAEGQNNRIFIWAFVLLAFAVVLMMFALSGAAVIAYLKQSKNQNVVYVVHVTNDQIRGELCSSRISIR